MCAFKGGCVVRSPAQTGTEALAQEEAAPLRWARRALKAEPYSAPILVQRRQGPRGLRAGCTDEAWARYSRRGDMAAWKTGRRNTRYSPGRRPEADRQGRRRSLSAAAAHAIQDSRPMIAMTRIPNIIAVRRMFMRMSPFRIWLNSWPMTPCSSSRVSCPVRRGLRPRRRRWSSDRPRRR